MYVSNTTYLLTSRLTPFSSVRTILPSTLLSVDTYVMDMTEKRFKIKYNIYFQIFSYLESNLKITSYLKNV